MEVTLVACAVQALHGFGTGHEGITRLESNIFVELPRSGKLYFMAECPFKIW